MSASIERRLSRMLALTIVTAALSASLVNFLLAYQEAEEFQDETLRQIAFLVSLPGWREGGSLPFDAAIGDAPSQMIVARAPPGHLPAWLPKEVGAGFHTLATGPDRMRVFVHDDPKGERIVVAQRTDLRDDIAFESALPTLVPLFLLLPVVLVLTVYIVRGELGRVRKLAESVDRRPADGIEPLLTSNVPTEVGLFVAAINRLIARVNDLIQQQRRFVADAAHELRSPLTALALQAENVENADSLELARERILPLKTGIRRAQRLAEQLLSLAKTQTGGRPIEVDASRLARELVEEYQPLARERGVDLGLDERDRLEVIAIADTLRVILKNALENALSYTGRGGEVTLRLGGEEDDAIIEIIDNGPGIPADERDLVFAPFYRIPGTPGEGSGLGLAIAHDAAMQLGGSIKLYERNPCPGLVFQYRQQRARRR